MMSGATTGISTDDSFDFSQIEDLDPSLSNGYRLLYDREVPVEIRSISFVGEKTNTGVLESIKVKMLVLGSEDAPQSIRLELTSEADLFFAYTHLINEGVYSSVQEQQRLCVEFADYPNVLIRMLNACIREPHVHLAIFTMVGAGDEGTLEFIQNMEYKFVELMACSFERAPEEVVQQQITYRYNTVKQRLAVMQARLFELNNLVKTKNPSLLLQLQHKEKAPAGAGNAISSGRR
jgi:hypothetical protein